MAFTSFTITLVRAEVINSADAHAYHFSLSFPGCLWAPAVQMWTCLIRHPVRIGHSGWNALELVIRSLTLLDGHERMLLIGPTIAIVSILYLFSRWCHT
jgi:hypothetical protein